MALSDNLISWWKLNESSGNASDSVGSNTLTNSGVTYSSAKKNNGAVFNGSTSTYLEKTNVTAVTAFSFSFWINVSTWNAVNAIIDKVPAASGYRIWGGTTWSGLLLTVNGTNWAYSWTPTTGTWYHFVWTFDSGNAYLYLDGNTTPVNSKTGLTLTDVSTNTLCLGNRAAHDQKLTSILDEVGYWSRALTSSEVAELYNSGSGLTYPFPIAYSIAVSVGSFTLTVINSLLSRGWKLLALVSSFSITSINILLHKVIKILTGVTAYTLTGININVLRPIINMTASVVEYTLTGISAGLYKGTGIFAEVSNFTLTGIDTLFQRGIKILTEVTNYTLTGINTLFTKSLNIITEVVDYTLTLLPALFVKAFHFVLSVGIFSLTSINIAFRLSKKLITEAISFTLTGINVSLLRPIRKFAVAVSNYVLSGYSVNFRGRGDWTWTHRTKPTTSYTLRTKPTTAYSNRVKPTTIWTNKTKP